MSWWRSSSVALKRYIAAACVTKRHVHAILRGLFRSFSNHQKSSPAKTSSPTAQMSQRRPWMLQRANSVGDRCLPSRGVRSIISNRTVVMTGRSMAVQWRAAAVWCVATSEMRMDTFEPLRWHVCTRSRGRQIKISFIINLYYSRNLKRRKLGILTQVQKQDETVHMKLTIEIASTSAFRPPYMHCWVSAGIPIDTCQCHSISVAAIVDMPSGTESVRMMHVKSSATALLHMFYTKACIICCLPVFDRLMDCVHVFLRNPSIKSIDLAKYFPSWKFQTAWKSVDRLKS